MIQLQKLAKIYSNEILPFTIKIQNNKILTSVESLDNDNPLHFFRVFLNFGYFLYYIPFRVVSSSKGSSTFRIQTTPTHKGICGIVYILASYRFGMAIREVLNSYTDKENPSPVLYFEICRVIFTVIYMLAFKWTFWTRGALFCSIINDLAYVNVKIPPMQRNLSTGRFCRVSHLAIWICLVYSIPPLISVLLGSEVINVKSWDIWNLLESYAGMARYTFFLQDSKAPVSTPFDPVTFVAIGIYLLMNFFYFLGGHYFDLSVLMGALTLRNLACSFAANVKLMNPSHINKILSDYEVLKNLSTKVNKAIGPVAFCFVVEAIPWYATHFDDILTLNDWNSRFRYIFYFLNFFSILIFASDIIVKVETLKCWLSRGNNSAILPSSKLVVLINELSTSPVGLKPGGILTITYGFIGTMVSVVVTYAVIILQFNFASSHDCAL